MNNPHQGARLTVHSREQIVARVLAGQKAGEKRMLEFIRNFQGYRIDEVMQDWKPYADVVRNALERACRRNNVPFRSEDAVMVYGRLPTWGPHPDVPAGLAKLARGIPTTSMNAQIDRFLAALDGALARVTAG